MPTIKWTINEGDVIRRRQEVELSKMYKDPYLRYPNLMPAEHYLDVLVKALLGFHQPMGYKQGSNNKILNDSWTVNLISTKEESNNIMMDSFLRGFGGQSKELKKAWEDKQVVSVDVSDELKDLLKVYTDAEEHMLIKEKSALEGVECVMKRYLDAKEERKKVSLKLTSLKSKMETGKPREEDEDE